MSHDNPLRPGRQPIGAPTFEEVVLHGAETLRVPRGFFGRRYSAAPPVEAVENGSRGRLLRFGNAGLFAGMYLDPATGEVLEILELQQGTMPEPRLVNSTLGRFSQTVRSVVEMFPYYSLREAEEGATAGVVAEVARVISEIDPVALTPDSFWATFIDDMTIGDFATEDILPLPD